MVGGVFLEECLDGRLIPVLGGAYVQHLSTLHPVDEFGLATAMSHYVVTAVTRLYLPMDGESAWLTYLDRFVGPDREQLLLVPLRPKGVRARDASWFEAAADEAGLPVRLPAGVFSARGVRVGTDGRFASGTAAAEWWVLPLDTMAALESLRWLAAERGGSWQRLGQWLPAVAGIRARVGTGLPDNGSPRSWPVAVLYAAGVYAARYGIAADFDTRSVTDSAVPLRWSRLVSLIGGSAVPAAAHVLGDWLGENPGSGVLVRDGKGQVFWVLREAGTEPALRLLNPGRDEGRDVRLAGPRLGSLLRGVLGDAPVQALLVDGRGRPAALGAGSEPARPVQSPVSIPIVAAGLPAAAPSVTGPDASVEPSSPHIDDVVRTLLSSGLEPGSPVSLPSPDEATRWFQHLIGEVAFPDRPTRRELAWLLGRAVPAVKLVVTWVAADSPYRLLTVLASTGGWLVFDPNFSEPLELSAWQTRAGREHVTVVRGTLPELGQQLSQLRAGTPVLILTEARARDSAGGAGLRSGEEEGPRDLLRPAKFAMPYDTLVAAVTFLLGDASDGRVAWFEELARYGYPVQKVLAGSPGQADPVIEAAVWAQQDDEAPATFVVSRPVVPDLGAASDPKKWIKDLDTWVADWRFGPTRDLEAWQAWTRPSVPIVEGSLAETLWTVNHLTDTGNQVVVVTDPAVEDLRTANLPKPTEIAELIVRRLVRLGMPPALVNKAREVPRGKPIPWYETLTKAGWPAAKLKLTASDDVAAVEVVAAIAGSGEWYVLPERITDGQYAIRPQRLGRWFPPGAPIVTDPDEPLAMVHVTSTGRTVPVPFEAGWLLDRHDIPAWFVPDAVLGIKELEVWLTERVRTPLGLTDPVHVGDLTPPANLSDDKWSVRLAVGDKRPARLAGGHWLTATLLIGPPGEAFPVVATVVWAEDLPADSRLPVAAWYVLPDRAASDDHQLPEPVKANEWMSSCGLPDLEIQAMPRSELTSKLRTLISEGKTDPIAVITNVAVADSDAADLRVAASDSDHNVARAEPTAPWQGEAPATAGGVLANSLLSGKDFTPTEQGGASSDTARPVLELLPSRDDVAGWFRHLTGLMRLGLPADQALGWLVKRGVPAGKLVVSRIGSGWSSRVRMVVGSRNGWLVLDTASDEPQDLSAWLESSGLRDADVVMAAVPQLEERLASISTGTTVVVLTEAYAADFAGEVGLRQGLTQQPGGGDSPMPSPVFLAIFEYLRTDASNGPVAWLDELPRYGYPVRKALAGQRGQPDFQVAAAVWVQHRIWGPDWWLVTEDRPAQVGEGGLAIRRLAISGTVWAFTGSPQQVRDSVPVVEGSRAEVLWALANRPDAEDRIIVVTDRDVENLIPDPNEPPPPNIPGLIVSRLLRLGLPPALVKQAVRESGNGPIRWFERLSAAGWPVVKLVFKGGGRTLAEVVAARNSRDVNSYLYEDLNLMGTWNVLPERADSRHAAVRPPPLTGWWPRSARWYSTVKALVPTAGSDTAVEVGVVKRFWPDGLPYWMADCSEDRMMLEAWLTRRVETGLGQALPVSLRALRDHVRSVLSTKPGEPVRWMETLTALGWKAAKVLIGSPGDSETFAAATAVWTEHQPDWDLLLKAEWFVLPDRADPGQTLPDPMRAADWISSRNPQGWEVLTLTRSELVSQIQERTRAGRATGAVITDPYVMDLTGSVSAAASLEWQPVEAFNRWLFPADRPTGGVAAGRATGPGAPINPGSAGLLAGAPDLWPSSSQPRDAIVGVGNSPARPVPAAPRIVLPQGARYLGGIVLIGSVQGIHGVLDVVHAATRRLRRTVVLLNLLPADEATAAGTFDTVLERLGWVARSRPIVIGVSLANSVLAKSRLAHLRFVPQTLGGVWQLHDIHGGIRPFGAQLDEQIFHAAAEAVDSAGDPAPSILPDALAQWLQTDTWQAAQEFFHDHEDELVRPETIAALGRVVAARPDDPWRTALHTIIGLHVRARTTPAGHFRATPVATEVWHTEPVPDGAVDATFGFDYLMNMDRASRTLWNGLLLAAWAGGKVSRTELVNLSRAHGTSAEDKANAQVFEAVTLVVEKGLAGLPAAKELVSWKNCKLHPDDKLAWFTHIDALIAGRVHRGILKHNDLVDQIANVLADCV